MTACVLTNSNRTGPRAIASRRGFSLTELMVVIGIIVLLVGILLVALKAVQSRARESKTSSTMQQFRAASEAFQTEHGSYPGVVPDSLLAAEPQISPMENALLHLLGGYRLESDIDYTSFGGTELVFGGGTFRIKIDPNLIGDGPVINGNPFSPYFTPTASEFIRSKGQVDGSGNPPALDLPDLIDAWGQPMIYLRRVRKQGPLVGDASTNPPPQFLFDTLIPYIDSTALGEFGANQVYSAGSNNRGSILTDGSTSQRHSALAQILRHPAFGGPNDPLNGQARGAFVVISAGEDGVFFSAIDGAGTDSMPATDITTLPPSVVEEYDDIRVFGGS